MFIGLISIKIRPVVAGHVRYEALAQPCCTVMSDYTSMLIVAAAAIDKFSFY